MPRKYRLLIGGIGDDAHSVGIRLIQLGFIEAGFHVKSLGIRNELMNFFKEAKNFDLILISNKNGHAELYLDDFPILLSKYRLEDNSEKLWYLGGSLSVSESDFKIKKKFLQMGFTNVYPKPISFQQILFDINADILRNGIPKRECSEHREDTVQKTLDYDKVVDRKWQPRELEIARQDILREWPTGMEILTGEFKYENKKSISLDTLLWQNHMKGKNALLQPRTGVANIDDQISLLKYLEKAGSDISSVQLDAASRSKKFEVAQGGSEISKERRKSILNGFPLPIYKIKEVEKLVCSVSTPFQLRGGGPDHRFIYELALSANISGVEGGYICYLFPYDKLTSPIQSLGYWQYIDRLCAMHEEKFRLTINREYFGVLTATLIEPSLAIVVNIIQAVLSAQQGVKSISVGYAEQGNRVQDIAAIRVLNEAVNSYLTRFHYLDCKVTTVFHQFMAAFPQDYEKSKNLIINSAMTANAARATKIMVKTPVEALRIPSRQDNAEALFLCRQGLSHSKNLRVDESLLKVEEDILRLEVAQIMEAVIELGNGSIAIGSLKALEQGVIDIPWSPNIYNKNEAVSVRDINGAIRYHDFGRLPFSSKVKEFHQQKVEMRKIMERDPSLFSLLEKDLSRIWKNDFKEWPLDNCYVN